jgi:CCR4-NOT transcription complex subunit 2
VMPWLPQEDTLFYIFYSMPHEEAQLYAAEELASRGWAFHKELKAWLCPVPGTEPTLKSATYERGSVFLFDTNQWEVRPSSAEMSAVTSRPPPAARVE